MIPISLTIEGLYSYQKPQTIDFTDLTEAGLFGIFGAVGSGKSSILEAITFALYGETERMNNRENRNYNMMNLRSTRSLIDFQFVNFENKKYRITRSFRRNSKKYEDVKPQDVVLYLWENEAWVPQESSRAEEIVGLSYENFKRTIIIPQGQFKEFLELGATDRTRMLKEIFNLQRFDLQSKTASLFAQTKSTLDNLEGQLIGFEQISEEQITSLQNEWSQENTTLQAEEIKKKTLESEVLQMQHLKADFDSLSQKGQAFEVFLGEKSQKDLLKNQLEIFEKTQLAFSGLIQQVDKNKTELQNKSHLLNQEKSGLLQLQQKEIILQKEIETLKTEVDIIPQKREEVSDLQLIIQIKQIEKEALVVNERQEKGTVFVQSVLNKLNEVKAEEEQVQKQLQELKASKPNSSVLLEIENWFGQYDFLKKNELDIQSKITVLIQENTHYTQSFGALSMEHQDLSTYFENQIKKIESSIEQLRKELSLLEVQQQLSHYAHTLQDGEACPLCGALEHPQNIVLEDVSEKVKTIKDGINSQNLHLKSITLEQSNWMQTTALIAKNNTQIVAKEEEQKLLEDRIALHLKAFVWDGFDANDKASFHSQKQQLAIIEQNIQTQEAQLQSLTARLKKEQENWESAQQLMEQLRLESAQKLAQIQQNIYLLKQLKIKEFESRSEESISESLQNLQKYILEVDKKFVTNNQTLNDLLKQIAASTATVAGIENRINELKQLVWRDENELTQLLVLNQFADLNEVQTILSQNLDILVLRKELETYYINFQTLENAIIELKEKLQGKTFDSIAFQAQEQALQQAVGIVQKLNDKVGQLKAEVNRQTVALEKKKELLHLQSQTQTRAEHLKTLKNLFDRAGFVEYVSSIYLRQLCDMANVRFHRLTRNQLSLQLNDTNDFEIIDYLNEGKKRSVKTLSGGQSFQVSLSLALALAESVQSNAQAERNFFFIDEGFGTQDAESVNIVFETLMNLQKENRIVGIISHVEELKDKIPVSLSVFKDEEAGSIIMKSWE